MMQPLPTLIGAFRILHIADTDLFTQHISVDVFAQGLLLQVFPLNIQSMHRNCHFCLLKADWSVECSAVIGVWSAVIGVWSAVIGVWSAVIGVWSAVIGV